MGKFCLKKCIPATQNTITCHTGALAEVSQKKKKDFLTTCITSLRYFAFAQYDNEYSLLDTSVCAKPQYDKNCILCRIYPHTPKPLALREEALSVVILKKKAQECIDFARQKRKISQNRVGGNSDIVYPKSTSPCGRTYGGAFAMDRKFLSYIQKANKNLQHKTTYILVCKHQNPNKSNS